MLFLSSDEREELTGWAQSRVLPAGDVFRARLILALSNGLSYRQIEEKLNTRKLRRYIRAYEKHAKPFRWTYTNPQRRIRTNSITGTAH